MRCRLNHSLRWTDQYGSGAPCRMKTCNAASTDRTAPDGPCRASSAQTFAQNERIARGEIEAALLRHSDVRESAVIAIPDSESVIRILAFVSCQHAVTLTKIALKS